MWISKLLGFLYVIPFIALVGLQGNILYEYAYKPYAIMLSVSTMGIPIAISQFVSKYNELGEYDTSKKILKASLWFTIITGIIGFVLMYSLAPFISEVLVNQKDTTGNNLSDIIYVIRMVSTALLIVPAMSAIRGYFQGYGATIPTAISQVLEQLVRVVFILVTSYYVLHVLKGDMKIAIGWATFAATLGAVAGMISLIWYLKTWKIRIECDEPSKPVSISTKKMTKELVFYAIPIVIASLAIPIYQLIETYTINGSLMNIGYTQGQAETANSIIALVQKLILIPVGLASAFGLTLVPAITNAYTAKNSQLLNEYITKTFKVLFFVLMPTIILLMVFSKSVFGMLFGWTNAVEGGRVTFWYAPSLMLYSLFIVTAAILQGINKHKFVLFSLFVGVIAKFVLNPMLTMEFKEVGVIMSTNIGFLLSVGLNAWAINKYASFPFGLIAKQIKTILLLSIGMFGFGYILNYLLAHLLQNAEMNQYVKNLIILAIAGGLSGLFFLVVSIKSGLLFELLGDRFRFLKRIKKRSEKRKSIA
jgi:O-antigen/teichoic acid export membrane protein